MSVIATIIDIAMCVFMLLATIGGAASLCAIVWIIYCEIKGIREDLGDNDE